MNSNKQRYRLINPIIEGTVSTVVEASNAFNSAKKMYKKISNYFTNTVDDFYMTIQNVVTKDLTHFKINEQFGENGIVDFNLVKIDANFSEDIENKLLTHANKLFKHRGGKKHKYKDDSSSSDSSSSSSSSDSYYYKYPVQPISKFIYFYLPYYKLIGVNSLDARRLYMPMFGLPVNPSLEIRFDLFTY